MSGFDVLTPELKDGPAIGPLRNLSAAIRSTSALADRVLTLTTQRENLRAALEDVEADPAFPKLCVRLRKRIADLLETT